MIVTCVTIYVRKENIDDFLKASVSNHEGSIREPGNLRFDILQSKEDPARFMFYEAYESKDAVGLHKKTDHYLNWRKTVEPWMAIPRAGVPFNVIAPEDKNLW